MKTDDKPPVIWSDATPRKAPDPMQRIFGRTKATRPPVKPAGVVFILGK